VSIPEPANLRPHDLARVEIETWRGRCLNVFARMEKSVTETLMRLQDGNPKLALEPLAGQRFKTLEGIMTEFPATPAQQQARRNALASWRELDVMRPFFSHGILTELIGRTGEWHLQLDFIAVRKGKGEGQRLNWSKAEALAFEERLQAAFKALTNQLGQLRKAAAPPNEKPSPDPRPAPGQASPG
jgi:hypothetical protein